MKKIIALIVFVLLGINTIVSSDANDKYVKGEIIIKIRNLPNNYRFMKNDNGVVITG